MQIGLDYTQKTQHKRNNYPKEIRNIYLRSLFIKWFKLSHK